MMLLGMICSVFMLLGCAALKNPQATLPNSSPEAIARTVLDTANSTLNIAVSFYADQANLCKEVPANKLCRFSSGGLNDYEDKLNKANKAFLVAVIAADAYKSQPTAASQAAMSTAATDLKSTLGGLKTTP